MNNDKECVMIQLRNGKRGRRMRNLGKGFLTGLGLLLIIMPVMAVFAATNVTGIDHSTMADGGVRIALQTSGDVPQVSVFATENPARIVLDLAETDNQAGTEAITVGQGSVQQYSAIGAGGRTRLIVDLSQAANYDYSADAGQVVLTIAGNGETGSRPSQRSSGAAFNVTGVDFRRGEEGQSRVIIRLDRPGASMSVKEGSNTVSLDIFNSNLPESLDQQLRKVIVTPDMHRVHHSVHRNEHDSNYGFCLSIWDRLFRTYIAQPEKGHDDMQVGLEWQDDRPTRLGWTLSLPFVRR